MMKNNKNTILFDLDSTLLQVNQDLFLKNYFELVSNFASNLNFDSKDFNKVFYKAAYDIILNDGSQTNESRFWNKIKSYYGEDIKNYLYNSFESFYNNDFKTLENLINKTDIPNKIIKKLKEMGYNLILATNPLYPRIAILERIKWTGIDYTDFKDITSYETSTYCKPKKEYFLELLKRNNINPNDCYMIGNDIDDDFIDLPSGIDKILITDYMINKNNKEHNIKSYSLEEFYNNIDNIF